MDFCSIRGCLEFQIWRIIKSSLTSIGNTGEIIIVSLRRMISDVRFWCLMLASNHSNLTLACKMQCLAAFSTTLGVEVFFVDRVWDLRRHSWLLLLLPVPFKFGHLVHSCFSAYRGCKSVFYCRLPASLNKFSHSPQTSLINEAFPLAEPALTGCLLMPW